MSRKRLYLLGLRLAWWNKGIDDFLSLIFVCPLVLPISLVISVVQSILFSYYFILRKDTHSFYYDLIDKSGLSKCHLHNRIFRLKEDCPDKIP